MFAKKDALAFSLAFCSVKSVRMPQKKCSVVLCISLTDSCNEMMVPSFLRPYT